MVDNIKQISAYVLCKYFIFATQKLILVYDLLKKKPLLFRILFSNQAQTFGRVAQLVQSTWFTPKGSGVRIPSRPHKIPLVKQKAALSSKQ